MEAINSIRQRLKRVVFVWIPAHTAITPNVYADAIAKAHTENSMKLVTARVLAKEINTRSVIYESEVSGIRELADRPCFGGARRDCQSWVRSDKFPWGPKQRVGAA